MLVFRTGHFNCSSIYQNVRDLEIYFGSDDPLQNSIDIENFYFLNRVNYLQHNCSKCLKIQNVRVPNESKVTIEPLVDFSYPKYFVECNRTTPGRPCNVSNFNFPTEIKMYHSIVKGGETETFSNGRYLTNMRTKSIFENAEIIPNQVNGVSLSKYCSNNNTVLILPESNPKKPNIIVITNKDIKKFGIVFGIIMACFIISNIFICLCRSKELFCCIPMISE